jgi:predicted nucleic acid-binding protein
VIIDNNIILDSLLPNKEFEESAKEINESIAEYDISAYICANSLTDIYYFLRKAHPSARAKAEIATLIETYEIIPLTKADCTAALSLEMNDFEDAIISVCAQKMNVDYIVSRDKEFLKSDSPVPVITPQSFLKYL